MSSKSLFSQIISRVRADHSNGVKTSNEHWDSWHKKHKMSESQNRAIKTVNNKLRRIMKSPLKYRLDLIFKRMMQKETNKILDIGCAPGDWLVYFQREFDFEVYGVDYSKKGCEVTKEALSKNGVEGTIICEDIFTKGFQTKYLEYFNVVFSAGVVEHFTDPTEIIRIHLEMIIKGGFLIIMMPNYANGSLYRKWYQRKMSAERELLKTHNTELMEIPKFKEYLEEFNLQVDLLNYVGPINLTMMLPFRSRFLTSIFSAINVFVGYLTIFLNSDVFSPYIVLIARKLG
ncbi:class I SAM-dependent methyltransferase [Candidatus Bathyarchaeota archaeon]|nr:class I SAM-dependent methyltransferase [Candidatus Bathyarchaeota archaeon]